MDKNIFLSIVIPVYNEEENLELLYKRLKNVLNGLGCNYEIIFVNDGSTDNSLEKLINLHKNDNNIKIIDFSRNFGKEIALTAGLDFSKGDVVITMDADLQHPPELIPEFLSKYKEGYDVVYTIRKSREDEKVLKRFATKIFYKLMKKFVNINIPENAGDFRLLDRKVVESLKKLKERNRYMKGLFAWVGFSQTAIYYEPEKRYAGKTKYNYFKLLNLALEGITSFSNIPLQIASYLGFIIAILSFIYATIIIAKTIVFGKDVPGYASLITIILFLGGVQLISIGILGEYIGRIYNEVKQRPLYIVRKLYTSDDK